MNFQEKMSQCIERQNSVLCIGLDTVLEKIPPSLRTQKDALFIFNKMIIDATLDIAAAYKINTAFYEACGIEGWLALKSTFEYLPSHVIKIADAKRGDIGNTSVMYAKALFEGLGADAVTVNPLMGYDSVQPFLQHPEKGVFFLCLTSNSGSQDFQYFSDGQTTLYQRIAIKVREWNKNFNCGLVVGATHPEELSLIRQIANVPLLIPGIGAQGGDLDLAVQYGTDQWGQGALYNSSRAIIYASSGKDFGQMARKEAQKVNEELNKARQKKRLK